MAQYSRNAVLAVLLAISAVSMAATMHKRIVNGDAAESADFPSIVSLTYQFGSQRHFCGGSLLNGDTVITAAHCVTGMKPAEVQVRAGSLEWKASTVRANVSSFLIHDKYSQSNTRAVVNDIAIVKLSSPIESGPTISYAKLTKPGSDPGPGSMATISGWGQQEDTKFLPELRKISVPVVARDDCRKSYSKPDSGQQDSETSVTDDMFCAGKGNKDSCKGDSGGPVIDQATGIQIGVTSFGKSPCGTGPPGVYVRLGNYIPFVMEQDGGTEVTDDKPSDFQFPETDDDGSETGVSPR